MPTKLTRHRPIDRPASLKYVVCEFLISSVVVMWVGIECGGWTWLSENKQEDARWAGSTRKLAVVLFLAALNLLFLLSLSSYIYTYTLPSPLPTQAPTLPLIYQLHTSSQQAIWPALSLVVIDRIPFPRPDEPVMSARAAQADAAGGSGFMQISLPRAALLLAQGTGRLIRSVDDRGVVAILDSRIVTKRYGSTLLNSMPPLWRTSDSAVVRDSLRRLAQSMKE